MILRCCTQIQMVKLHINPLVSSSWTDGKNRVTLQMFRDVSIAINMLVTEVPVI